MNRKDQAPRCTSRSSRQKNKNINKIIIMPKPNNTVAPDTYQVKNKKVFPSRVRFFRFLKKNKKTGEKWRRQEKRKKKCRGVDTPAFPDHDVQRLAVVFTTLRARLNIFVSLRIKPNQTKPKNKRGGGGDGGGQSRLLKPPLRKLKLTYLRYGGDDPSHQTFVPCAKRKEKARGRRQKASRTLFQQPPTITNTTALPLHRFVEHPSGLHCTLLPLTNAFNRVSRLSPLWQKRPRASYE